MSGMFGNVPQIQVPDFGATLARVQGMQANRLAMLAQQRQLDNDTTMQNWWAQNGGAFATATPQQRLNLLAQLSAQPGGAQLAMPLMQRARDELALDGPEPAPVVAAAPSGGGMAVSVPAHLEPIIREEAARFGIPYEVAARMIRQESNFNPAARGRAGEVGLMQIMPSTARNPGWGMAGVDPATLDDPRNNVRFGLDYFSRRGRARGVTDWNDPAQRSRALLAYNGGGDPNYVQNVERWQVGGGQAAPVATAPRTGAGDTISASGPVEGGDTIPAQAAPGAAPRAPAPPMLQRTPAGNIIVPGMDMARVERALRAGANNPVAKPVIDQYRDAVAQHMQALQLERRGEAEQMEVVEGPNGQPILVPRSQSGGMRPASRESAPRTPERLAQDLRLAEAGAARSNVQVNSGDRQNDINVANAWRDAEATALNAGRRAALLGRAEQAFERFQPGALAERRIWLGQMARELGIQVRGTSEGEVLQQVQRQLELAATPLGQGSITENERALIRQAVPVLLSTPEGARAAIQMIRRLDDFDMGVARIYRENARQNGGQINPVSVREQIAEFAAQNQAPDVQAIIENLSGPAQGGNGLVIEPPAGVPAPPRGFRIVQ